MRKFTVKEIVETTFAPLVRDIGEAVASIPKEQLDKSGLIIPDNLSDITGLMALISANCPNTVAGQLNKNDLIDVVRRLGLLIEDEKPVRAEKPAAKPAVAPAPATPAPEPKPEPVAAPVAPAPTVVTDVGVVNLPDFVLKDNPGAHYDENGDARTADGQYLCQICIDEGKVTKLKSPKGMGPHKRSSHGTDAKTEKKSKKPAPVSDVMVAEEAVSVTETVPEPEPVVTAPVTSEPTKASEDQTVLTPQMFMHSTLPASEDPTSPMKSSTDTEALAVLTQEVAALRNSIESIFNELKRIEHLVAFAGLFAATNGMKPDIKENVFNAYCQPSLEAFTNLVKEFRG